VLRLDEAERTAHRGADHHCLGRLQTSASARLEIPMASLVRYRRDMLERVNGGGIYC
jgi:hypothetical protein